MIRNISRGCAAVLVVSAFVFSLACSPNQPGANANLPQKNSNATPSSTASAGPPVLEGFHDIASCDGIVGWGWDQKRPDEPIKIEIFDGENLIANVSADTFRQDLLDNHKGNGKHGFVLELPPTLKDGKPHTIRVRFAGTTIDLGNSPKQINCKFEQK